MSKVGKPVIVALFGLVGLCAVTCERESESTSSGNLAPEHPLMVNGDGEQRPDVSKPAIQPTASSLGLELATDSRISDRWVALDFTLANQGDKIVLICGGTLPWNGPPHGVGKLVVFKDGSVFDTDASLGCRPRTTPPSVVELKPGDSVSGSLCPTTWTVNRRTLRSPGRYDLMGCVWCKVLVDAKGELLQEEPKRWRDRICAPVRFPLRLVSFEVTSDEFVERPAVISVTAIPRNPDERFKRELELLQRLDPSDALELLLCREDDELANVQRSRELVQQQEAAVPPCENCGAASTVHIMEVQAGGPGPMKSRTRHLCDRCADVSR